MLFSGMVRAAKRACRRRVASAETVCRVPAETWVIVCANLFFSPHTVFRLMMACKHLWNTLSKDAAWWDTFVMRVIKYQDCLNHSNISQRLFHLTYRLKYPPRQALQLMCSPRCSACGARFGHVVFRPLRTRICTYCLQSCLVSNRVLALRYGLDVADFIVAYAAAGGMLLPLDNYLCRNRLAHMSRLTRDPADYAGHSPIMFLLRADVERVLGVRLDPDAVVAQRARIAAACVLAACVRRAHACYRLRAAAVAATLRKHRIRNALQDLAHNELQRVMWPIAIPDGYILGGPMCAMAPPGCRNATRRRAHLSQDDLGAVSRHMYAPLGFSMNTASSLWL